MSADRQASRGSPEQPIRVLHLSKYLPPQPGGIERFLGELMPALRRQSVASAALVHAGPTQSPGCRKRAGALAIATRVIASVAFTPISPTWPCRLRTLIKRWRPAVLHLHLPNPSAFWALVLPSARRVPWLVHWHADVPVDAGDWRLRLLYRFYRPLETWLLRRATLIVASSEAYARSSRPLQRWRDKTVVVPLGLPDDHGNAKAQPALWPPGPAIKLLFVGRFSYYKGLDVLLRALAACHDIDLLLVGSGDQEAALRHLVRELGLEPRVRFAGALPDSALASAYATADALCLPSIERSEAFGVVLLEAMRARVTAIATRVEGSGMTEVLDDGRAGVLTLPGNAEDLTRALVELRDQPERRHALAEAGRQRFQSHYLINAVAAALASHYRQLADDPRSAVRARPPKSR